MEVTSRATGAAEEFRPIVGRISGRARLVTIRGQEERTMPTYAELRQHVLATLAPGVEAGSVLWGLAYAASRRVKVAQYQSIRVSGQLCLILSSLVS